MKDYGEGLGRTDGLVQAHEMRIGQQARRAAPVQPRWRRCRSAEAAVRRRRGRGGGGRTVRHAGSVAGLWMRPGAESTADGHLGGRAAADL